MLIQAVVIVHYVDSNNTRNQSSQIGIDYSWGIQIVSEYSWWIHTVLRFLVNDPKTRQSMPNVTSQKSMPLLAETLPDSKVHGANMGQTWVLSDPDGPRVGPMNLAIWDLLLIGLVRKYEYSRIIWSQPRPLRHQVISRHMK